MACSVKLSFFIYMQLCFLFLIFIAGKSIGGVCNNFFKMLFDSNGISFKFCLKSVKNEDIWFSCLSVANES